jgi:hypothetical protein
VTQTSVEWHWRSYDDVDLDDAERRRPTVACGTPWNAKLLIAPTMNNVTCADCNAWLADFLVQRSAGAAPLDPPSAGTVIGLLIGENVVRLGPPAVKTLLKQLESRALDVQSTVHKDGKSILIRVRGRQILPDAPAPQPLPHPGVISTETVTAVVQAVLRERGHFGLRGFDVRLRTLAQVGFLIDVEGVWVSAQIADEVAADISDRCNVIVAGQLPIATRVYGSNNERRSYVEPRRRVVPPPPRDDDFGD